MRAVAARVVPRGLKRVVDIDQDGGNETVLLMAGLFRTAEAWAARGYVQALAPDFRVLVLPGIGHREDPTLVDGDTDVETHLVADVVRTLDARNIGRAHLFGYDLGAWLAYRVAARFPERVSSVIAGGFGSASAPERAKSMTISLRAHNWGHFWAQASLRDGSYWDDALPPIVPAQAAAVLHAVACSRPLAGADRFPPCLVFAGCLDPVADEAAADGDMLGAPVVLLEGQRHWSAYDNAETVVPIVRSHLETSSELTARSKT